MINNVVFFCKKDCKYSLKLSNWIKKNIENYNIIYSNKNKQKIIDKIKLKKIDYIFSFRSHYIINQKLLNKCTKLAVNFHPGTPDYRGIGCANFAILNNEKSYGCTAHIINNKIDNGKIIEVKKFELDSEMNLESLLKKTHLVMYNQAKSILKRLKKNKTIKFDNVSKWSKKLYKKKDMLALYNIKIKMNKKKLENLLRATRYKTFKPYITLNNYKFFLYEN